MNTTLDVASALSACIWPIVVLVILLAYRKPLGLFLSGLSGRLTKLSAFNVSIELAVLPTVPLIDPRIPPSSELAGGDVDNTSLQMLFHRISADQPWDYLMVDIKDGKFWFVSRVFTFTVFLQAMRGVKCIVFVESKGENRRRLIGIALPDEVRTALSTAYPWLEEALSNALVQHQICRLHPALRADSAGTVINTFIAHPKMRMTASPGSSVEWTQVGTKAIWEHTQWLTLDLVNGILRKSFLEWDSSHYKDSQGISTEKKVKELLQCKAPFIAIVNSKDEFQGLLDRQKLAILVGEMLIEQ